MKTDLSFVFNIIDSTLSALKFQELEGLVNKKENKKAHEVLKSVREDIYEFIEAANKLVSKQNESIKSKKVKS